MIKKEIGKKIKNLRLKSSYPTQIEFAKKIGWDRSYLSRVEAGKQNLTLDNLELICKILKISPNEFLSSTLEEADKKLNKKITYVSLFSSAGVGCFGFKKTGFECVATNEIIEKRLNIQKLNHKCKYDSGYISGDITLPETKKMILDEINFWKTHENIKNIDILMATPPCQGMSTANYKKGDEIERNSLVVEAIHMINLIQPRIFVFENVRAFLSTMCVDSDDEAMSIQSCIEKHLSKKYNFFSKVINFCDYGIPSSRPRTIVIGTLKSELNFSPLNIFPLKTKHVTLRDAIFSCKRLKYGQHDKKDILHSFRIYPKYMQKWIHNLKEGETAFDNAKDCLPYKIVNGKKVVLKGGFMGNKFCRMFWDKPAPCITTRNDQLASQSTIHPEDDRVLSIRELMKVMTIPDDFVWTEKYTKESIDKNESLIRQSIGEAVPTGIITQIAKNIKDVLEYDYFVNKYHENKTFVPHQKNDNFYIDSFIYEQKLSNKKETGSFYTPQSVVYNTIKDFQIKKDEVTVLEPSVGAGAFIPQLLRLLDDCKKINIDMIDISNKTIDHIKNIFNKKFKNKKINFNFIVHDFLTWNANKNYDLLISNPPYFTLNSKIRKVYKKLKDKTKSNNIFVLFLDKYKEIANDIAVVIPKTFLMTPDSNLVRLQYQQLFNVKSVYDYGVDFFKDVFIEIISVHFTKQEIDKTHIVNFLEEIDKFVKPKYIYHNTMWLLYRDEWFDKYISNLNLNIFNFYRDRQITNKYLSKNKSKIWVLRSRNLLDNGKFVHIKGYDRYISSLEGFNISKFYNKNVIVFPNFTYNTRASYLPKNCVVNGSFCILIPKITKKINLKLYSTDDFRKYYRIVKNLSNFTLNVDNNSIHYIGMSKND